MRRVAADGTGLATLSVPEQAFGGIVVGQLSLLDAPGEPPAPPARAEWSLRAPNPARAGVSVEFSLPAAGDVRLDVIDAAGRRVATLAEGVHAAGVHRVTRTGALLTEPANPRETAYIVAKLFERNFMSSSPKQSAG